MTLFSYRGIPFRLHTSFLLLAAVFVGAQLVSGGLTAAAGAALMGSALFGSVLLHELGHALVARRYGINTRAITLYPFGGIAALEAEPEAPEAELAIALAGPAVNMVLALAALPLALLGLPGAGFFASINLGMGLFNLVPAFPMDGGRVLRAWWSRRAGALEATRGALKISRAFAWAFAIGGLFVSPSLALVGLFLLWATAAEARRLERREAAARARGWRWDVARRPVNPARFAWEHPAS